MAAQTVYPMGVGMFTPTSGMPLGGEGQALADISRTDLAAPQLVMLANVALTSDGSSCDCLMEEKQMVELKTVGSGSYSDSEDDSLVRYGYDSHAETPASFYPEAQQATASQAEEEEDEGAEEGEDQLSPPENGHASTGGKRKRSQRSTEVSAKKKKPFHCKPCQYQAECEEEFVHHIRVHSAKKLIVVGRADGEEPAKEPPLPEGGESVVYTKGVIRCERCGYNTNRYDHYMAHLKHHSKEGDSQRVYKCTICTYTTVSQYHWKKHLRNHFPSKLYTCAQCCYFSDRKNNYVQHIRTHTGERPFRCPYCKYSSSQKTHLTRHMRTHSGERPFKCDSCSYLAANQHEVTRHARQVHNGPKPLSCPHCQYKTADRSNYKKHVELHVNPRQFLCPVCSYAASKKCNLQYHIKSRHPDCAEITMDVSKVKLRVKKPEAASACYNVGGNSSYALTEAQDGKEQLEEKTTDEPENADPVNLSTGKSRSAPAPRDKAPRKVEGISEDESVEKGGEKLSLQKAEKKEKSSGKAVKNAEKVKEAKRAGKASKPAGGVANGRPRRERKAGRSATHAEEKVEKKKERERAEKKEKERADRLENERVEREREEKKRAEEKETKNSVKSVKGASKKTDKTEKHAEERVKEKAPESQKPLETTQKKGMKTYNGKRKFVNEEPCPPEKEAPEQPSVCRTSKRRKDTHKHAQKDSLLRGRRKTCQATKSKAKLTKRIDWPVGVQQKKKTKKRQSEKKLSPEGTGEAVEIKEKTSEENATGPMQNEEVPIADLQEVAAKPSAQIASPPQGSTTGQSIIEEVPQMMETPLGSLQVSVEQVRLEDRTEKDHEEADCEPKETLETCSSSSGSEESSDLRSAGSKVPHSPLELPRVRHKPADTEEDEGIHSHDGSDISDSVSEGSDDSGLSVLQAASDPAAKVSAPETPAEEPCVPATLHSHTCIFCDRSFSMEVEYRRHLNRHLVNVYYLENAAEGDQ